MKYAIKAEEILTRTVIVDHVSSLDEAKEKVKNAYNAGNLMLSADNSTIELTLSNDTESYRKIFGEDFDKYQSPKKSSHLTKAAYHFSQTTSLNKIISK